MTAATATALSPQRVSAAARASYIVFFACGFDFATWASRIPQARHHLHLSPADLGLVLLSLAAGSLFALPLAGTIVHRIGSRRTVAFMSILGSVGLSIVGIGYLIGVIPVVIGLFVYGFATGAWDVSMNVQGATVERQLGRAIMPSFHAGYSAGTVGGALLGAIMVLAHISVTIHILLVVVVIGVAVPYATHAYVADVEDLPADAIVEAELNGAPVDAAFADAGMTTAAADGTPSAQGDSADAGVAKAGAASSALARWREPRTLIIGLVVLAFAFSEGGGNDWIGVSLIDGYHAPAVVGSLAFATFLTAMTAVRWFGTGLLDRYGRIAVLRGLAVVAVVGLVLFVFSPFTPLAFVGAALWGAGASLGFPVGMSAAADEPGAAASRVSVVASIGYCAFLGGPPLIGFLGNHITVRHALLVIAILLALSTLVVSALRPPHGADSH